MRKWLQVSRKIINSSCRMFSIIRNTLYIYFFFIWKEKSGGSQFLQQEWVAADGGYFYNQWWQRLNGQGRAVQHHVESCNYTVSCSKNIVFAFFSVTVLSCTKHSLQNTVPADFHTLQKKPLNFLKIMIHRVKRMICLFNSWYSFMYSSCSQQV